VDEWRYFARRYTYAYWYFAMFTQLENPLSHSEPHQLLIKSINLSVAFRVILMTDRQKHSLLGGDKGIAARENYEHVPAARLWTIVGKIRPM